MTRLELLRSMYKSLMKMKIGTNAIESESMKLVQERVTGPTGHRLLRLDRECVGGAVTEDELLGEGLHCWRDPTLVKRLTGIRMKEVTKQLKEAKVVLSNEMKFLALTGNKAVVGQAWQDTRDIRRHIWAVEHPRIQRKISHLVTRSKNCGNHKICRGLDKVWEQRQDRTRARKMEESDNILETDEMLESGSQTPPPKVAPGGDVRGPGFETISPKVGVAPPSRSNGTNMEDSDPCKLLSRKYYARPEDLDRLKSEHVKIEKLAQSFNKLWKKNPDDDVDDSDVITFGDVTLTENEMELLRLGPGFMVMSDLDENEMKVEANVTMTKVRWSRSKKGVQDMTEEEVRAEVDPVTEEEESLAEAIESEMRDVLTTDGKEMDMGRKRPTDMRNNRDVRMPGPAPAGVEAQYTTRLGAWQAAYNLCVQEEALSFGLRRGPRSRPTSRSARGSA